MRHLGLQVGGEAQAVVDDDALEIVEATLEVLHPHGRALQAIRRADVEHEKAVHELDQRGVVEARGEEVGMPRPHAAIAADVEIPADLGGNDAHILALRLGAFPGTPGNGELELVRGTQALVAILDVDGHANAVEDAVATPSAADAGLHGAHRLAVGVAGLEAGVDQLAPNQRQFVYLGTEEIDALAASDLGVKIVLLGHLPEGNELVRRDLPASNPGHDGVGAVLLHVGEEVVVGVLQRRVLGPQHVVVPAGGEDGRSRGLADVAATALAVLLDQFRKRPDARHAHQVVELLTGVGEVLADVGVDLDALAFEFGVQHLRHERGAATAAGGRLGAASDGAKGGCALADGGDDGALGDVVAGADLGVVRQRVDGAGGHPASVPQRQDQAIGMFRQRQFAAHGLQQHAVVGGVAHQDGAQELLAGLVDDDALVHLLAFVDVGVGACAPAATVGVADAGDIDAQELELGAHVGAAEGGGVVFGQHGGGNLGHLVAGCDEAEDATLKEGALADGEDVGVRGAAALVDDDAAAFAYL